MSDRHETGMEHDRFMEMFPVWYSYVVFAIVAMFSLWFALYAVADSFGYGSGLDAAAIGAGIAALYALALWLLPIQDALRGEYGDE